MQTKQQYTPREVAVKRGKKLASYLKSESGCVHYVPFAERRKVREQVIQKEISDYLKSCGGWVVKYDSSRIVGSGDSVAIVGAGLGIPDLIVCFGGMFVAIEVKKAVAGVRVSGEQMSQLERVRQVGGHSLVAHSVECVRRYFTELEKDPSVRLTYPICGRKPDAT